MMRLASLLLCLTLFACANAEDYEEGLSGAEAKAWQSCKKEMANEIAESPESTQATANDITFSWDPEKARSEGGPILCRTTAEGTEVIELRESATPFG